MPWIVLLEGVAYWLFFYNRKYLLASLLASLTDKTDIRTKIIYWVTAWQGAKAAYVEQKIGIVWIA